MTAPRPHFPFPDEGTGEERAATVVPFPSRHPTGGPAPAPAATGHFLPLAAVLLTAIVAQVALASRLAPAGASPDLLLLSTAAVATARGREVGAAYGFSAGLAADLFVATPFGLGALVFTAVGHVLGRSMGARRSAKTTARAGGLACLGGGLVVVSLGAVLTGGGPVPAWAVLARLVGGSVVAALLAPPVFAAVRRIPGPPPPGGPGGKERGREKEGLSR